MNYFDTKFSVLCYGHDELLLMTRQWLLERTNCAVMIAMSHAEFRKKLSLRRPDLVVLCHTLLPAECEDVMKDIAESCPNSQCLLLYAGRIKYVPSNKQVLLDMNRGPAEFISTIHLLLPSLPSSFAIQHSMN